MLHIYEIESDQQHWEVWKDNPGMPWQDDLQYILWSQNELDLYIDICERNGVDFVIHTLEEYDEYHVALPSV